MLELVDKFLAPVRAANSKDAVVAVLRDLALELGFRSAVLVEYVPESRDLANMLDTDPSRGTEWWGEYMRRGMRERAAETAENLRLNSLVRLSADRYADSDPADREFMEKLDLLNCLAVPVNESQQLVGAVVFSGEADLSDAEQMGLQLLVYNIFAQVRLYGRSSGNRSGVALTPREREVMYCVADGRTSSAISSQLGISARTVNQHIENVSMKLGTKNRVQTAAEAVRLGLLD